ncbi:hypothetical protein [Celeribacter indicus]|uniref:Uncharacterized protein n=1 Tax=Celeribacter indicus TaxID=1208324 RepID=A0A0B5E3F5_9RHOB|nr:hypothetical protein [Celeribacter indicus]AJE47596.1 hypothetical protein P73_2881 [Celeribacter indicus]SDW11383.1 hypothetical protein SAMN05443573_101440 [Celeribacter indicus]
MRHGLVILLIGLMAWIAAPQAGMAHAPGAADRTAVAAVSVHHARCPDCAEDILPAEEGMCPHGALCLVFTDMPAPRMTATGRQGAAAWPPIRDSDRLSRAPALDLPPPRPDPAKP